MGGLAVFSAFGFPALWVWLRFALIWLEAGIW